MFCSLLKAKLEIEARVTNLHKKYLELLSSQIREIKETKENNAESAKIVLETKIEKVNEILQIYKTTLDQHHQTSAEIFEAKETAEELEYYIDDLFEVFDIEIPEDLKRPEQEIEKSPENIENQENSKVYQEIEQEEEKEEEEDQSDKENSDLNSSGGYFSPNIQIQKASLTSEVLYTPAVKSSSKFSQFKQNF